MIQICYPTKYGQLGLPFVVGFDVERSFCGTFSYYTIL